MQKLYFVLAAVHLAAIAVTGILWAIIGLACLVVALAWTAAVLVVYSLF
jgi:hypothetical protein